MPALTPFTLAEADAKLTENQATDISTNFVTGKPIRTDSVQVASLSPVEDGKSFGTIDVGNGYQWHYWGVYHGHSCVAVYAPRPLTQDSVVAGRRRNF